MQRSVREHLIGISLIGAALFALAACVTPKPGTGRLEVRTLYSSVGCDTRSEQAAATWLDSPQAFAAAYRRLSRSRLEAGAPPEVNFDSHGVLLVEMGRQNTGGYRLLLADPHLFMAGGRAQLHVAWLEPEAGAMVPQVITSPCLLLEIPKGDFSAVQVVDQAGRLRATADVEKR